MNTRLKAGLWLGAIVIATGALGAVNNNSRDPAPDWQPVAPASSSNQGGTNLSPAPLSPSQGVSTTSDTVACIRWNADWHRVVSKKDIDADEIFAVLDRQSPTCETSTDTFAYGLWHSTWASEKAVEGWPDCKKSLITGARVIPKHASLGCADGYTQIRPTVTQCTDGSTLVALDDDVALGHRTAFGRVGKRFTTGVKDLDLRADSGYADALESCLGSG